MNGGTFEKKLERARSEATSSKLIYLWVCEPAMLDAWERSVDSRDVGDPLFHHRALVLAPV